MAITNHERVGKALELLKAGLAPFVDREFKSIYKDGAMAEAARFLGQGTLTVEAETYLIRENDVVFIPAGMKHSLSNLGQGVFEIFEIYAPSGRHFDFVLDE